MVAVALAQLRDPMNLMLIVVTLVSIAIGEMSTGVIIALLIVLNVVLGSRQELKARASVDALAKLQVPQARVVRDGEIRLIAATDIVPGDVIAVEAGDIVPADGRVLTIGHAGDAGGRADRRERADPQGCAGARVQRGRSGRSDEHAVPEHLGDPGHWGHGRHGDRYADADGSDRDDADEGLADQVAAPEGAGHPDQGPRPDRLGRRGGDHRRRVCCGVSRCRTCCCWARRWRSRPSRPGCPRSSLACWPWGRSSWPRRRRWSRT